MGKLTKYQNLLTSLLEKHAKLLELADGNEVKSYRLFDIHNSLKLYTK